MANIKRLTKPASFDRKRSGDRLQQLVVELDQGVLASEDIGISNKEAFQIYNRIVTRTSQLLKTLEGVSSKSSSTVPAGAFLRGRKTKSDVSSTSYDIESQQAYNKVLKGNVVQQAEYMLSDEIENIVSSIASRDASDEELAAAYSAAYSALSKAISIKLVEERTSRKTYSPDVVTKDLIPELKKVGLTVSKRHDGNFDVQTISTKGTQIPKISHPKTGKPVDPYKYLDEKQAEYNAFRATYEAEMDKTFFSGEAGAYASSSKAVQEDLDRIKKRIDLSESSTGQHEWLAYTEGHKIKTRKMREEALEPIIASIKEEQGYTDEEMMMGAWAKHVQLGNGVVLALNPERSEQYKKGRSDMAADAQVRMFNSLREDAPIPGYIKTRMESNRFFDAMYRMGEENLSPRAKAHFDEMKVKYSNMNLYRQQKIDERNAAKHAYLMDEKNQTDRAKQYRERYHMKGANRFARMARKLGFSPKTSKVFGKIGTAAMVVAATVAAAKLIVDSINKIASKVAEIVEYGRETRHTGQMVNVPNRFVAVNDKAAQAVAGLDLMPSIRNVSSRFKSLFSNPDALNAFEVAGPLLSSMGFGGIDQFVQYTVPGSDKDTASLSSDILLSWLYHTLGRKDNINNTLPTISAAALATVGSMEALGFDPNALQVLLNEVINMGSISDTREKIGKALSNRGSPGASFTELERILGHFGALPQDQAHINALASIAADLTRASELQKMATESLQDSLSIKLAGFLSGWHNAMEKLTFTIARILGIDTTYAEMQRDEQIIESLETRSVGMGKVIQYSEERLKARKEAAGMVDPWFYADPGRLRLQEGMTAEDIQTAFELQVADASLLELKRKQANVQQEIEDYRSGKTKVGKVKDIIKTDYPTIAYETERAMRGQLRSAISVGADGELSFLAVPKFLVGADGVTDFRYKELFGGRILDLHSLTQKESWDEQLPKKVPLSDVASQREFMRQIVDAGEAARSTDTVEAAIMRELPEYVLQHVLDQTGYVDWGRGVDDRELTGTFYLYDMDKKEFVAEARATVVNSGTVTSGRIGQRVVPQEEVITPSHIPSNIRHIQGVPKR